MTINTKFDIGDMVQFVIDKRPIKVHHIIYYGMGHLEYACTAISSDGEPYTRYHRGNELEPYEEKKLGF